MNVGAVAIVDALRILLSDPLWERTLIVSFIENGGSSAPRRAADTARTPGGIRHGPDIDSVPSSGGIRRPNRSEISRLVISYSRGH